MLSLEKLFRSDKFCFAAFSLIFLPSIPFSVLVPKGSADTIPVICIASLALGIISVLLHLFFSFSKLKFHWLDLFRTLFFSTAVVGAIFAGTGAVHPYDHAILGEIGNSLAIFGLIGGELSGFVKELKEKETGSDQSNMISLSNRTQSSTSLPNDEIGQLNTRIQQLEHEIQRLLNPNQTPSLSSQSSSQ